MDKFTANLNSYPMDCTPHLLHLNIFRDSSSTRSNKSAMLFQMKIKLIIFDLDGTLVDSANDIMSAANAAIVHYGSQPLPFETIKRHIGDGLTPFIRGIAGERSSDP